MTPGGGRERPPRRWRLIPPRLRAFSARTPLRLKLVATLLSLVSLALVVSAVTGVTALRGYLVDKVDAQLHQTGGRVAGGLDRGVPMFEDQRSRFELPGSLYLQVLDADGSVEREVHGEPWDDRSPPELPLLDIDTAQRLAGEPFTVSSRGQGARWRVLVLPLADGTGSVAVAMGLDDVQSTVSRLALVNFVVGMTLLTTLAALGYALVRSSLRPLAEVERTAAAIAAGDLSRRVPERDRRTEVGRLAGAFNSMVAQIEDAFQERQASEAAARESEQRMRRFVTDASHELRTPLTSIRGFAELHRQGAVAGPEEQDRVLRRIEDEAARMGLLVDDLLLLARLDQQRPLARRPTDLLTVAADAVQAARVLGPDHVVALKVTPGAAPVVIGDEARLRQVVTNLLSNAVMHTPPGTRVAVSVGTDGGQAVLTVADDGPGMASEDAARAFERFYRADPSRSRALGGTGLGLAIVAALVRAHSGSVELDTAPGAGTTFRVLLPL